MSTTNRTRRDSHNHAADVDHYGANDAAPFPGATWHYSDVSTWPAHIKPAPMLTADGQVVPYPDSRETTDAESADMNATSMQVTVIGPNLGDQSKGSYHVHAAGCADIARMARRDPAFRDGWTFEASSAAEVCDAIYPPEEFDCESGEYLGDLHFAPCCKGLA